MGMAVAVIVIVGMYIVTFFLCCHVKIPPVLVVVLNIYISYLFTRSYYNTMELICQEKLFASRKRRKKLL